MGRGAHGMGHLPGDALGGQPLGGRLEEVEAIGLGDGGEGLLPGGEGGRLAGSAPRGASVDLVLLNLGKLVDECLHGEHRDIGDGGHDRHLLPFARPIEGGHALSGVAGADYPRVVKTRPDRTPVWPSGSTVTSPFTTTHSIPSGKLPRLVVRGVGAHAVRIEDDEVGGEAVADQAAVAAARAGPPGRTSSSERPPRGSSAPPRARTGRGRAGTSHTSVVRAARRRTWSRCRSCRPDGE